MKLRLLCISASALLLGGIIYVLLYSSQPAFLAWIPKAGFKNWLNVARHSTLASGLHLPQWIIYSLPDGLWAFAYALLITGIWNRSNSRIKYFWMSTIPVLVIGFEILQYTGRIKGTFSFMDIAFEISGLLIGIYTAVIITKPTYHEKSIS
jgi:hypothetical protein